MHGKSICLCHDDVTRLAAKNIYENRRNRKRKHENHLSALLSDTKTEEGKEDLKQEKIRNGKREREEIGGREIHQENCQLKMAT